jgi:hypothetical protein
MNRFTAYLAGLLSALFLLMGGPSFAKSSVRIPSELVGTQQVMTLLRKVNVPRTEQRARQGAVDILEFKSQLYNQSPLLRPGVTGFNATGKVSLPVEGHKRPLTRYRRFPQ